MTLFDPNKLSNDLLRRITKTSDNFL